MNDSTRPLATCCALLGVLDAADTHAVLKLVAYARPIRVLVLGQLDRALLANLSDWTPEDATIYGVGPRLATFDFDHFGQAHKLRLVPADPSACDLTAIGEFDFIVLFCHDVETGLACTRQAYAALTANGWLLWPGFGVKAHITTILEKAELPDTILHAAGTSIVHLHKQPHTPPIPGLRVRWEGDVDVQHSLAVVNRALVERLQQRGHAIHVAQPHTVPAMLYTQRHPALAALTAPNATPQVIVRHAWPPNLTRADVPVVLIQPWEYGALPQAWVEAVQQGTIAEWWVPSRWLRAAALEAGVPSERIGVVPNGVDVSVFRPDGVAAPLATTKRFRFLFVGGTIYRKGFDLLLRAYAEAFTAADDVCLVVKDVGAGEYYQAATDTIRAFQTMPNAPALEYLADERTDEEMAALYRACQCLVLPYRGEGFGLPVAEAMACGVPCLVTRGGSTDDWCTPRNAYFLPAQRVVLPEAPLGLPTVGEPWVWEVEHTVFVEQLRYIATHADEAARKGRFACADIRAGWTWNHAATIAEARLRALVERPTVSLTMIVKNEERYLAACLESVHDLVDEIVIVDTGSTDATKSIAAKYSAKVLDFPWPESFAVARNEGLRHATGTFVFWMDADDRLDEEARTQLRTLFRTLPNEHAAYVMKCYCLGEPGTTATVVDHVRLFRRRDDVRWKYRVHEQILPAIRATNGTVRWTDITITHVGYADEGARLKKLDRDWRLLQADAQEQPNEPFTLFNLGHVAHERGDYATALGALQCSLAHSHVQDSIVRKLYALIAQCQRQLGDTTGALVTLAEGRTHYPHDAEMLYAMGQLFQDAERWPEAVACYQQLLTTTEEAHFASVAEGLRSFRPRYQLARVCVQMGRIEEAATHYEAVLAEYPEHPYAATELHALRTRSTT